MIRPANHGDIDILVELGIESLEVNDPYEELRIDKDKIRAMAKEVVSSASNFSWVSEKEGKVVGAVCGLSHDIMFYERKQLSVLLFYCREPGDGGLLIRRLVKWFHTRPILKMLVFTLERGADPKIGQFLGKLGLDRELPVYVKVK